MCPEGSVGAKLVIGTIGRVETGTARHSAGGRAAATVIPG